MEENVFLHFSRKKKKKERKKPDKMNFIQRFIHLIRDLKLFNKKKKRKK